MSWFRPLASLKRPSTLALVLVALSFGGLGLRLLTRPYQPPYGGHDGWSFTDHFSHMNAARLFMYCGTCVWTKPVGAVFPPLNAEQREQVGPDLRPHMRRIGEIFSVPGWAPDKPLLINWSHLPRPYPPGVFVLVAPVALAYHFTDLSFFDASRWLFILFLFYAHIGFYFLLRGFQRGVVRAEDIGLLGAVLVYGEFVHWSLEGIYDGALLAPLVLSVFYLRQQRGLAALVSYCIAAFIHYRAFFLAPLPLYAAYLILRERQWRHWRAGAWAALGIAGLLAVASLYTFWLVAPWLRQFPRSNPLHWRAGNLVALKVGLVSLVVMAALLHARAWMDMTLFSWFLVMTSRVLQTQGWHPLVLVAWLAFPTWTALPRRVPLVRDARLLAVWTISSTVFGNSLLPTSWAAALP